ncbi:MAG: type IV pili methyl-accepting chemotaxis transducer N-terminal domain-containing protein [Rhodocyclales bacterium]|nr:type IV pili methyl-accepting chemotaxis transducer N-terminal domain-containing protein [Rhodocyclales bacterium]
MLLECDIDIGATLGGLPLFAELAPELLGKLAHASRLGTYRRNQVVYRIGDAVKEMHILLSGQVKLAISGHSGKEKIIDVLGAGHSFGEAELFGIPRYLVTAAAVKPSQILSIAAEALDSVMTLDQRLASRIVKLLAHRQIELEAELAANHFRSGNRRLLEYFLRLAAPTPQPAGETRVKLAVSKQLLASRFDMQPETLSRKLREFADAGLLVVEGSVMRLQHARIATYLADEAAVPAFVPSARRQPARTGASVGSRLRASAGGARRPPAARPPCEAINLAGRQRMLSQRMAKSWLMLGQGVCSRRARQVLERSIAEFDSQLQELESLAGNADARSARQTLRAAWLPYRVLLESEPSRRGALKLFRMNEEVLKAAQALTLSFERVEGTVQGRLVNLAGRERMLSQRMAKFFMFQHMGIRASTCRAELAGARDEFAAVLVELAAAVQDRPRIAIELDKVAGPWHELKSALARPDAADFAANAHIVFGASERLLRRMEAAVHLCARPAA